MVGSPASRCKRRTGIEPASSPWKGEALPLSYHRTREPSPLRGPPTMTVCTNDLASCNLVEDRLPRQVADALRDIEALVANVVELKDQRVGLAAVRTRPLAKDLEEQLDTRQGCCPLALLRILDVAVMVLRVMLPFIGSAARAAVVVPLPPALSPPGEVVHRLRLAAATAGSEALRLLKHKHMFARTSERCVGASAAVVGCPLESAEATGSGAVW
jgi:hypothetical protein